YNCGLRTHSQCDDARDDLMMFAANYGETVAEGLLAVALMCPVSRGRIKITAGDLSVQPSIGLRMLSEARDLSAMRSGIRMAFQLARSRALARVTEEISAPALGNAILADDAELDRWLRLNCEEFFHATGTCRMGSRGDPQAVVDPEGRVMGVESLLVCDASIVPGPLRAPTHLTAVMIAERFAERLLGRPAAATSSSA